MDQIYKFLETIDSTQRAAKQLPGELKLDTMSPVLGGDYGSKHPADGYLVGESEDTDQHEPLEEATDLYDQDGIQLTRYAMGKGRTGLQVNYGNRYIQVPAEDVEKLASALQSASTKMTVREGPYDEFDVDSFIDNYRDEEDEDWSDVDLRTMKRRGTDPADVDDYDELDELDKSTLSSYIQKAVDPGKKKSNVNLASKAAHKLATSDDWSAGDKEDHKAYMRSKGIQTAAKKLAKEAEYNKDAVDKEIKKNPKIKGKEAKAIHALLKGRSANKDKVKEAAVPEDIISTIKQVEKSFGDYLKSVKDVVNKDKDLQNKDANALKSAFGPTVKTIKSGDDEFKIHGNEDEGFKITIKGKPHSAKFKTLDEAQTCVEMYCNKRMQEQTNSDYVEEN